MLSSLPIRQVLREPSSNPSRDDIRQLRRLEGLCGLCANIDLEEILVWPRLDRFIKKARRWNLPALSRFLPSAIEQLDEPPNTASCPLCAFVARLVFATPKAQQFASDQDGFVTAVPRPFAIDISLRIPSGNDNKTTKIDICTLRYLPDTLEDEAEQEMPFGRAMGPKVTNSKLIANWLTTCDERHGCIRAHQRTHNISPNNEMPVPILPSALHNTSTGDFILRVLDVATATVVDAPPDCRYAALSYVWGDMNLSNLSRHMISSTQGYMSVFGQESLPQSLSDAIGLCQELAIPYLWIDCLCILQSDAHDKHVQINNMDRIYSQAYMTIVSAAGENANAGLPGVNPGSRQSPQSILGLQNLSMITTNNFPANPVINSYWYTRGWTFQEFMVSRRILLFTNEQTLFICREAFWTEDIYLEGENPHQKQTIKLPREFDIYSSLQVDNMLELTPLEVVENIYLPAVAIFTQRSLSRDDDALDAFSGLQKVLEPALGPFLWGLPIQQLWRTLIWGYHCEESMLHRFDGRQMRGFLTQRDNMNNRSGTETYYQSKRRPRFPSWSWAGFEYTKDRTLVLWPVGDAERGLDHWRTCKPAADIFLLDEESHTYKITEGIEEFWQSAQTIMTSEEIFMRSKQKRQLDTVQRHLAAAQERKSEREKEIGQLATVGAKFGALRKQLLVLRVSVVVLPLQKDGHHYVWRTWPNIGKHWNVPEEWLEGDPHISAVAIACSPNKDRISGIYVKTWKGLSHRLPIPAFHTEVSSWVRLGPVESTLYLA